MQTTVGVGGEGRWMDRHGGGEGKASWATATSAAVAVAISAPLQRQQPCGRGPSEQTLVLFAPVCHPPKHTSQVQGFAWQRLWGWGGGKHHAAHPTYPLPCRYSARCCAALPGSYGHGRVPVERILAPPS